MMSGTIKKGVMLLSEVKMMMIYSAEKIVEGKCRMTRLSGNRLKSTIVRIADNRQPQIVAMKLTCGIVLCKYIK